MKEKKVDSKSKKIELQKMDNDQPVISKSELFKRKLEEILKNGQK